MDGLASPFEGHALLLADLCVLLGEALAQVAGARVDHRRRAEVDAEFGGPRTHLALLPQDGEVGDPTAQQPAGRKQDAVVVTLGQHNPLAVGVGALHQLVGEHLRGGDGRDRDREALQHVGDVDAMLHQMQCGVDLGLRRRRHPAAGIGHRHGRRERVQVGGDDRQPQTDTGHQPGDLPVQ